MEIVFTIVIMVVIGAAIGGMTNSLAIKMLFRPYRAIYIGKRRVPFTPGLIPKRREELAKQLGKMVVNHLLTPDSIQRKFEDPDFKADMVSWVKKEGDRLLSIQKTITELAEGFQIENVENSLKEKVEDYIKKRLEEVMESRRHDTFEELLPNEMLNKLDQKVPKVSEYIIKKGIEYFDSDEGKERLGRMIDDFLETRGTLGNMVQMFLGNESLVNKVQPEVLKFLRNPGTHELLTNLLKKEWGKVKEWKLEKVENMIGTEKMVDLVTNKIVNELPVQKWLHTPISDLTEPFKDKVINSIVPRLVDMVGSFIAERVEEMMERLHLAEIVRNQVETFSVDRLEEMVLSISRREFKMITYLGALLGGLIGIVQAVLVLLI